MSSYKKQDPEIYSIINDEISRQENELQMIASENYASKVVMDVVGSVLTNKYAEGYPNKDIMVVVNLLTKLKSWRLLEQKNYLVLNQ